MIESQEIIERSLYTEILNVALALGVTLNPKDYHPPSLINEERFNTDIKNITDSGKPFVGIFGIGNNQSRDQKWVPRITIESQGFYPGDVGLPRNVLQKNVGVGFTSVEIPYEAINQYIDIRLVANTQEDMRLLHTILFSSLPQRGYIKPWPSEKFLPEGNIFLEVFNFYNRQDLTYGILEKVYQFTIFDTLLEVSGITEEIAEITDISFSLNTYEREILTLDINNNTK